MGVRELAVQRVVQRGVVAAMRVVRVVCAVHTRCMLQPERGVIVTSAAATAVQERRVERSLESTPAAFAPTLSAVQMSMVLVAMMLLLLLSIVMVLLLLLVVVRGLGVLSIQVRRLLLVVLQGRRRVLHVRRPEVEMQVAAHAGAAVLHVRWHRGDMQRWRILHGLTPWPAQHRVPEEESEPASGVRSA